MSAHRNPDEVRRARSGADGRHPAAPCATPPLCRSRLLHRRRHCDVAPRPQPNLENPSRTTAGAPRACAPREREKVGRRRRHHAGFARRLAPAVVGKGRRGKWGEAAAEGAPARPLGGIGADPLEEETTPWFVFL
jgi:hypothetical protein